MFTALRLLVLPFKLLFGALQMPVFRLPFTDALLHLIVFDLQLLGFALRFIVFGLQFFRSAKGNAELIAQLISPPFHLNLAVLDRSYFVELDAASLVRFLLLLLVLSKLRQQPLNLRIQGTDFILGHL